MIPRIPRGTVELCRLAQRYAARPRAGTSPLDAYPTLDALLSALVGRRRADPGTRRRLLCAVIAEHQATRGSLGAAIVLHAFRGMLVRLSKSLVGVDDRDEADGIVVAGLLEALQRVRPGRDPERIGMYVRQETRRAVFAALRRDARTREYQQTDEEPPYEADASEEVSEPDQLDAEAEGDEAWTDEPPRDPLALQRAWLRRAPDAIADPLSLAPPEDRMLFLRPSVDGIPDETLLRAHAVRGGLRRLANLVFEDGSPRERERVYREMVRRTERLLATSGGLRSGNRHVPRDRFPKNDPRPRSS
jgi:DNA-directed RNA polymerase specialized sigma24 family protein